MQFPFDPADPGCRPSVVGEKFMAKTILVVEDDFDTRHPLAELLRLRGYAVTTVPNADLALLAAREQPPDLILTDIILPGPTGLQLIHAVRADERTRTVPVVVISGCEPAVLKKAEQEGANFCLKKPIQLPLFWATLARILKDDEEKPAEKIPEETYAGTIDSLIGELQQSSAGAEKELALRRLKDQLLNARNGK